MPTSFEQLDRTVDGSLVAIDFTTGAHESNSNMSEIGINEKALFLQNMVLTEPDEPKKKVIVPNHLLETKIYAKLGQNASIQAKPSVILFEGFEVGKKQTRQLILLNASTDVLRMHIIPPQTDNFSIKYAKQERMVAGMTLKCTVEFTPDEWRYYYDCIRIHCHGEDNLIVPIHGYPIMSTKDFPRNYIFSPIPVGSRSSKSFPLKSMAPIDFEFSFDYIQAHPALSIEPLSGIVPANGEAEVTVTFVPFEFQTAIMKVQLSISQFNFKGIVCTFTGTSQPGLLKAKTLTSVLSEVLDPKCVSPIERSRIKRKSKNKNGITRKVASAPSQLSLEKNGIRFPAVINSPSAVAKVLLQEPGKLKVNEMNLSELLQGSNQEKTKAMTRQIKEALFDQLVRQNVYEERQNQLRWQIKLGDQPMMEEERYKVLEDRQKALDHYMFKVRGVPIPEEEYNRPHTVCTYARTVRDVDTLAPKIAMFDIYSNDLWATRHAALDRFVQAARSIIIRNRGDKKLLGLKTLRKNTQGFIDTTGKLPNLGPSNPQEGLDLKFKAERIQKYKFPTYVAPNIKDDMAPDALGNIPVDATEVIVKKEVPFFNLKVPYFYQLYGYKSHNVQDASRGYIPTKGFRKLRTGAEDEVIKLPFDQEDPCQRVASTPGGPDSDLHSARVKSGQKVLRSQPLALTPPETLFKPIEYPSLHIMNPAPGLQVFQSMIPYAEVDYDYHLCPVPRYPYTPTSSTKAGVTQKKFLDREDTIRGLMNWKKFPSPGLTSLSNTVTLTNVWVPRWDECFNKDLMPTDTPLLQTQLEANDAENCVEDDVIDGDAATLTPAMVNAKFAFIDTNVKDETKSDFFPIGNRIPLTNMPVGPNGPIAREKREKELDDFMTRKYNKLRSKLKAKVTALNSIIKDTTMHTN
ncbi:unnamed protein product [Lymnaea stagnalis]|uniref:Primary ciliary dyskinesia protein 1 n=1 Tax=Lymnaea stagnalis TaxID=6523 RepID=A0AAV2HYE8_LYMST